MIDQEYNIPRDGVISKLNTSVLTYVPEKQRICNFQFGLEGIKMKNIIIVGPSRSGKSTLAKKIQEELNYYVISLDKLVAIFQNSYPQLDIRLNWDREKTTENIAPFLGHYLGLFSSENGKGLFEYSHGAVKNNRFIIEGAYYDFDRIKEVLKLYEINDPKEHFHLIGLVQRKKNVDEFVRDFRKYDTENDWTYSLSDDELRAVAEDAVLFNETMYKSLSEHDFTIYDTSDNREIIFDEIIKSINSDTESGELPGN